MDYYNPVVSNWTPECQEIELFHRINDDYCLYVITPKMTGVYSIAEVVDDSNKRPNKTLFCVIEHDEVMFTAHQLKSLNAVKEMVSSNGAKVFNSLEYIALFLNDNIESLI